MVSEQKSFLVKTVWTLLLCGYIGCLLSCNSSGQNTSNKGSSQKRTRQAQISITSPQNNQKQALGTTITLAVKLKKSDLIVDSLRWLIDGKWLTTTNVNQQITWQANETTTGTHRIEAVAYYPDGQRDMVSANVILLAAKVPEQYAYKVLRTYPHEISAYTQGLLFDEGCLYESTGLKGESTLRKVNITTGKPIQILDMPVNIFAEGLALVDNKLIQLTYQDQVAFVYNKTDFQMLNKINYPMKEGWGLTYDGTHLLMTDGTATVYFLDKEYLAEIRRIEVCDHKGPVYLLNELEYVNGELWANIYRSEDIARINPKTGEVIGYINMKGLLNAADYHSEIDVLNGIAYDSVTGKIYVTGKKWPKLFEIQVVKR